MARVAVGLVHWPVRDRAGNLVATNITNFDIHDIGRACRAYGVENYYLIHRMAEQQMFVHRIVEHWKVGRGSKYSDRRKTALTMVKTASSVQQAVQEWAPNATLISTSAQAAAGPELGFRQLRSRLQEDTDGCYFLLFGTGYGLSEQVLELCSEQLEPIRGATTEDYRHLSVRTAVSICLDRLLGSW